MMMTHVEEASLSLFDTSAGNEILPNHDAKKEKNSVCKSCGRVHRIARAECKKNYGSKLLDCDGDLLVKGVTYGLSSDLENFARVLHKHGNSCDSCQFCQQFERNLTAGVLLDASIFTIVNKRYGRHDKRDKKKRPDICWEEQRKLGSGSGGVCRRSQDLKTSREFCSKKIEWSKFNCQKVLSPLILDHEGVVKILGLLFENHDVYIFTEYYEGDSLLDMMTKHLLPNEGLAREKFVVTIMIRLVSVLQRMKECGIVHGDLHDGNVIITRDGSIKVIDFGSSRVCNNSAVHPQHLGVPDSSSLGRSSSSSSGGFADDIRSVFKIMLRLLLGKRFSDGAVPWRKFSISEKLQALSAVGNESLRAILELTLLGDNPDLCVLEALLRHASEEIDTRIREQDDVERSTAVPTRSEHVAEVPLAPEDVDSAQIVPDAVGISQDVPQPSEQIVLEPDTDVDVTPRFAPHLQGTRELVSDMQPDFIFVHGQQQQIPELWLPSSLNESWQLSANGLDVYQHAWSEFSISSQSFAFADFEMNDDVFNDHSFVFDHGWNNSAVYEVVDSDSSDSSDYMNEVYRNRVYLRTADDVSEAGSDTSSILSATASFANMTAEDADTESRYSQCSDALEDRSVDVSGYTAALQGDVGSVGSGFRMSGHELAIVKNGNYSLPSSYMQSSFAEDTVFGWRCHLSENLDVSSSSRELPSVLEGMESEASVPAIRHDDSVVQFPRNVEDISATSDAGHGNSMSSDSTPGFRTLFSSARGMSYDSTFSVGMSIDNTTAEPVGMRVGDDQGNDAPNDTMSNNAAT